MSLMVILDVGRCVCVGGGKCRRIGGANSVTDQLVCRYSSCDNRLPPARRGSRHGDTAVISELRAVRCADPDIAIILVA